MVSASQQAFGPQHNLCILLAWYGAMTCHVLHHSFGDRLLCKNRLPMLLGDRVLRLVSACTTVRDPLCRAAGVALIALAVPSASWAAPMELQRVYSGPKLHAFVSTAPDWCQEEVTLVLFGPTQEEFQRKDRHMFGYQAEIAAAVRRKCPQMATAVIHGVVGSLDALRPLPGGYVGRFDDHPKIMVDYQYDSAWKGEPAGVPLPSYTLRDSDRTQVARADKAAQDDKKARDRGELIAPSKEQMQGYITHVFARMIGSDDISGNEVVKQVGHVVLARYTNTVENLDCPKAGVKYRCSMTVRSSTGPSVFLQEQSSQTLHSVSDVCMWKARQLHCEESEKLVANAIAERQRAAAVAARISANSGGGAAETFTNDGKVNYGFTRVNPLEQWKETNKFFDDLKKIQ